MANTRLVEQIVRLWLRFFEEAQRYCRQLGRELGLSPQQFEMLMSLQYGGALAVSAIAKEHGLHVSTAGQVLDRLALKGFVAKVPNPADRRERLVSLTEAGRQALQQLSPAGLSVMRHRLRALPDAEVLPLLAVSQRLVLLMAPSETPPAIEGRAQGDDSHAT